MAGSGVQRMGVNTAGRQKSRRKAAKPQSRKIVGEFIILSRKNL
jgi:hypothetical protein